MKKTFVYSTISQVVLLAIANHAMANEQTNAETATLDEISVVGGSMYRMGEVPVHQAKSAVAINREELDKQNITKADEIGRYQAGFANQVFGEDTNTNWFRVRGAEVTQAVDGLPTFSYGFFTPYVNTFGLEAVEITKGADAMTFGAAQSGGLINYVSKRPHKDQIGKGEFKINVGNNAQYGFAADYTGAMNTAETLRYRLVTSYGGKDGQWDNTKNETLYIAPSFEWDISDRTRLTILTNYQQDKGVPSSNFLPQEGTLVASPNGYISRSTNLGDPVNDKERNRQYGLGYEFNHDFANGFSVNSSYRYSHVDNYHRGSYAYPSAYDANWAPLAPSAVGYALARGVVFNDGKSISHAIDNNVTWKFENDWLKNTLVVGTDYRHQKVDALYTLFGSTAATNVFNSAVGYNQTQDVSAAPHVQIKARQLGFYLQNQSRFADKIVLGLGVRHDRAKQDEYTSTQSVKANHTSYSASLMYEAPFGINPYFAYSESFRLPVGLSGNQTLYDPNTTRQYEVGVKYLPTWLDGVITVAGFQAKDKGALIGNGIGATVSSTDPVRRKGVELQADVYLTENWNLGLAYTYLKAVTQTSTGDVRKELLPKHTLATRTSYTFNSGALSGLTLGAGVRYVGSSVTAQGSLYSGAKVPSVTLVDLMARYDFNKNWSTQINVENVGDRRYVAGCDYYCYYGAGRNINAQVSYKF
ncbi:TonB-dependent siderophore receptor [Actinobacillus indolicus]|uniref:TonB-dependent siderophore receptor n=1 Tax=Actinobacillus indolicus TaxID=51049 RepID=A0A4P7CF18_9PAST|nr:TonB-dependent siderophore receptor [Actinobacillus indolicus]QBQ63486.1 TonB-dependent siderophore receptor [Actinobacillus indolicus]